MTAAGWVQAQTDPAGTLELRSELTASAPVGQVVLTHTVWNSGPGVVTNVWVTNQLSAGVSFRGTNKWPIGSPGPTYPEPPPPLLFVTPISQGVTFGPHLAGTNPPASAIAIRDMDLDGSPDLLVAHGGTIPFVTFQRTTGTNLLAVPTNLPVPRGARAVAVGDFDGDGIPDFACADAVGGGVTVFLQKRSDAGGLEFVEGPAYAALKGAEALVVMDFDGDGIDDLVVLEPSTSTLHFLHNTTKLGFAGFKEVGTLPTPPQPTALGKEKKRPGRESPTLASLGRLYITSEQKGGTVAVFLPTGQNSDLSRLFIPAGEYPSGPTPRAISVEDLDGDGLEDLVIANGPDSTLTLLRGGLKGSFSPAGTVACDTTHPVNSVHILDIDCDGRPDLVAGSDGAPDCIVIPNSRSTPSLDSHQFGTPVHFDLGGPFQTLGFDSTADGSQQGAFVAVGHSASDPSQPDNGPSYSILPLTHPGVIVAVPLGDIEPGVATGVSFDLEVRVGDATSLARAVGIGGGVIVTPWTPVHLPHAAVSGSLWCVSGGVVQPIGGASIGVVLAGTGLYESNYAITLPNGSYVVQIPFACGLYPVNTLITVTTPACPGQVWTFPAAILYQTGLVIPPLYCTNCVTCTNIQNTVSVSSGRGPSGLLPVGSLDPQFSTGLPEFTTPSPYVTTAPTGWIPNGPQSQWVGPDPLFQSPAGVYRYTNTFYLPCTNSGRIRGQWTVAGEGAEVLLNGASTGISIAGSGLEANWYPLNLASGFVSGWNTLVFCVTNPIGSAGLPTGPTGLRVEFAGRAACCAGCVDVACPTNMLVEICTNGPAPYGQSVQYPASTAFSHCGQITNLVSFPPSGSFFPMGTNIVTTIATDSLGNTAACSFLVVVQPDFTPPLVIRCPPLHVTVSGCPPIMPDLTTNVVVVDNCSGPGQITITQFPPAGTPLFGPQTTAIVHMCDAAGNCRDCDVILTTVPTGGVPTITCPPALVLLTCTTSAVANFSAVASNHTGTITYSPPSGSPFPLGVTWVTCTATNSCGGVATCFFPVTVRPAPWRWFCWHVGIGIPFEPLGGASVVFSPVTDLPGGPLATMGIVPAPGVENSGVVLHPGMAQAITFTTELDFTAPVGAGFDIFLPPDPAHPNPLAVVSFRNKGRKGYCVKTMKFYDEDPAALMRGYAVSTNGDLLDPITFTLAEIKAAGAFDITFQPGVTNCHVTVELDFRTGAVSVEFPGPVVPASQRKGWDGLIYGPDRPVKKPKQTSRITLVPPVAPPQPPVTDLNLYASGVQQVPIQEPSITAKGKRWGDGHVTLMKAYDDDSVEFVSTGSGGGVHVELGNADSFNLRLTRFETNAIPGEELLTRTIGPLRTTNRPAPPFLDALLLKAGDSGIDCSADLANLGSPTVRVQILRDGALLATRAGVPAELGRTLLTLPTWPEALGKISGPTPCRRIRIKLGTIILAGGGGLPPQSVDGDECRIIAELPPGSPLPDAYTSFEFLASEGGDWGVSGLQTTPACTPIPISPTRTSDGVVFVWQGDGFRLQGAVSPTGPWLDLGVSSPVTLPVSHPGRFFRLICD